VDNGTWPVTDDFGFPNGQGIPEKKLNEFGFANMHEFRNWRWFKRYAGGPISDLGAHQIDVYNWMLGANPRLWHRERRRRLLQDSRVVRQRPRDLRVPDQGRRRPRHLPGAHHHQRRRRLP
jgi:hypothetical protein